MSFGLLIILLGIVAGLGAYGFRALIAIVHNAAFLGELSIHYNANVHTPASAWGPWVILAPVLGSACVVFLVTRFAPEAKGHGVPEVMDAVYYQKSEIRPVVAAIKSLGSALSIGTGGSVGREGPIAQIGAAFGSVSGGLTRVARWQRATLVAAGGGAGIAATFNTPIGGVLFAVEILLHEVSMRTLVPVALATATATYVARLLFGNSPAFPVPPIVASGSLLALPSYLVLGCVTAFASVLFIRALYGAEDLFEWVWPQRPYLAHAIGMLGVGAIFTTLFYWHGHYYVQGVGYATIVRLLTAPPAAGFLLVLFALKLVATSLTLGSGASGGIFSPALFMGATLGEAFGAGAQLVVPSNRIVCALAGMAGMLSGTTGAVLTAVVMLFEMTLDYSVVLPMVLTASVSYSLRRWLLADSIYTVKLTRRGHVMPHALQANAHLVHHVSDLPLSEAALVEDGANLSSVVRAARDDATYQVVVHDGQIVDVATSAETRALGRGASASGDDCVPVKVPYVTTAPDATIFDLLEQMQRAGASVGVVVARSNGKPAAHIEEHDLLGVATKEHLIDAMAEGMEIFE